MSVAEVLLSSLCLSFILQKKKNTVRTSSGFNHIMAILSLKSDGFSSICTNKFQVLMSLDKMSWVIFISNIIKVIVLLLLSTGIKIAVLQERKI